MLRTVLSSLGLILACAWPGFAQSSPSPSSPTRHPEEGRPFIRTYRPLEVGGGTQTWAIVQDRRGVIYAATAGAVLEYDGASWRRIPLGSGSAVRSLALDPSGRVYVGGTTTFGYLAPDAAGELQYVPLDNRLPQNAPGVRDVWRTFVTTTGTYFQSELAIYRWVNDALTVIPARSRFNRSSLVDDRIYLTTPESGLNVLEGDVLRALPGTDRLSGEPFPVILKYDDRRLLIATRSEGLFLYDGATLIAFPTELDEHFKKTQPYRGTVLPDGNIALTSVSAGMSIIDRNGRRVSQVSRTDGLPSDVVYYVMPDRDGGLWLGLDRGISRVETPAPVSYFDESTGLPNGFFRAIRHDGRLYLASGTGVYYLVPASASADRARFEQVADLRSQCWWLTSIDDPRRGSRLLTGCTFGLYEIAGTKAVPIRAPADASFRAAALLRSTIDPSRIYIGLFDGLTSYRLQDGRWVDEGRIAGMTDQVRSLLENSDGSLWAGTSASGILRITFTALPGPGVPRPAANIERFGTAQGVPEGFTSVTEVGGQTVFGVGTTDPHIVAYDDGSHRFVRLAALDAVGIDPINTGFGIVAGPDGRAYLNQGRETASVRRTAAGWEVDKATFARLGIGSALNAFAEADGVVWLSMLDGRVIRYTTTAAASTPGALKTLIRRVTTGQTQSLFGGEAEVAAPRLPASSNALRFEFSAPAFVDEAATVYQSRLDRLDHDWSDWTRDARRDYTNLGFGDFRFRVK